MIWKNGPNRRKISLTQAVENKMTKPKVSQNADLADLPENAFATPGRAHYPSNYLALQNRVFTFTRLHLGGTDAQNDALGDARKQHLENAQLQAQITFGAQCEQKGCLTRYAFTCLC